MRQCVASTTTSAMLDAAPMTAIKATRRVIFASFVGLLLAGCAGGDGDEDSLGSLGDPCELDEHCGDGLICDHHNDQGSCQESHDH